ncbi:MAG: NAD(P)H-binding protein [Lacunisphaera sp.]|nr:NAD(P)H-binding protein [Lacunisphaera sp.]
MKIVITGTSGQIGRQLTALLDFKQNDIVLITRQAAKLKAEAARGATVLEGDMLDAAFMGRALGGADTLFFLPPPNFASPDMIAEYRQLATVAREAVQANRVGRIVHISTLGAHLNREETGLIRGQHFVETILREAAPHVLHLRNGFFLENYLMSAGSIAQAGQVYLPVSGEARYAFVATWDIAAMARDLLEAPTWSGRSVIEFQGPRDFSFAEVADALGAGLGRSVAHVAVSPAAAVEAMTGMGLSLAYARDLVRLLTSIESGLLRAEFPRTDPRVRSGGMTPDEFARSVLRPLVS